MVCVWKGGGHPLFFSQFFFLTFLLHHFGKCQVLFLNFGISNEMIITNEMMTYWLRRLQDNDPKAGRSDQQSLSKFSDEY